MMARLDTKRYRGAVGRRLPAMSLLILVFTAWVGPASAAEPWPQLSFTAMSTRVSAILPPDADLAAAREVISQAFAEVSEEMNEWRPGSPLAEVNRAAGKAPVKVPAALFEVVERSVDLGRLTDGAFDLTWAALWPLWRFPARGQGGDEHLEPPSAEDVANALALIDYRRVVLDPERRTVFLPRESMQIGLGGIAKGYALDRAAARLRALGLKAFLLDAGGQVLAVGERDGRPWRVGLRDPRKGPDSLFTSIEVRDRSVSTSGDYERFFVSGGVRYHHILDPRTGRPSKGLVSASAIAPDATLADALSTAFMVLGTRRSLELVAALQGDGTAVDAVLIDHSGAIHTSPGMRGVLERVRTIEVTP